MKVSQAKIDLVRKLRASGMTFREIADGLGISPGTADSWSRCATLEEFQANLKAMRKKREAVKPESETAPDLEFRVIEDKSQETLVEILEQIKVMNRLLIEWYNLEVKDYREKMEHLKNRRSFFGGKNAN